jgi:hypothetical protein
MNPKRVIPNSLFLFGVLILITGVVLLLRTTGYIKNIETLWPVLLVIVGIFFLYNFLFHGSAPRNLFYSSLFILAGIFSLMLNTVFSGTGLMEVWPIFMSIIGISITIYGLKKRGGTRVALLIPGITLIVLSLLFLPFSLDLIDKRIRSFARIWWPLLLILIGVDMIMAHFIWKTQRNSKRE